MFDSVEPNTDLIWELKFELFTYNLKTLGQA